MIFERKVLSSEVEERIFKRFSRSRANRLRHLNPRYNTSEIIHKVRHEWAMMDVGQKIDFFNFDKETHPHEDELDLENKEFSEFLSEWNQEREKHVEEVRKKREEREANKIIVFKENTQKWEPSRVSEMEARFEQFNDDSDFEREERRSLEFSESESEIGNNIKRKKRQSKQKKPLKESKIRVLQQIEAEYIDSIKRHEEVLECVRRLNEIDPEFIVMLRGIVIDVDAYDHFKKQGVCEKKELEVEEKEKENNVEVESTQKDNNVEVESTEKENPTENENKTEQNNGKVERLPTSRFGDHAVVDLMFQYPSVFKKAIIGKDDPEYKQEKEVLKKAKEGYSNIRIKRLKELTKETRKRHPKWSANQVATIVKLLEKKMEIKEKAIFDEACKKVYRSRILMKKVLCGKIVSNKVNHEKRCSKCIEINLIDNSAEKIDIEKSSIQRRSMLNTRSKKHVELIDFHKQKVIKEIDPIKSEKRKLIWKEKKEKKNSRMRGLRK